MSRLPAGQNSFSGSGRPTHRSSCLIPVIPCGRYKSLHYQSSRRAGFTIIEALVAVLIMFTSVAAMVSLWNFSFHMTTQADNEGVAYTIGRQEIERVKLSGFDFAPEGASTTYYSALGVAHTVQQNGDRFRVTTTVTSTGGYPSYGSTRAVTISVASLLPNVETLYRTGTLLVKTGI